MAKKFMDYLQGGSKQSVNTYATGKTTYGSGRSNPTSGPVDKSGYRERDAQASGKRNAALRRLKARQRGKFMSSDNLTPSS